MHIKLEHLGSGELAANIGQGHRRQRRYAKTGAKLFGSAPHRNFPLPMEQPLQGGGRQEQRHRHFTAEQFHRHIDLGHLRQHIGHQIAIGEGGGVAGARQLVVGGAIDIVEHRPRQLAAGEIAKIGDIVAIGKAHSPKVPLPARRCNPLLCVAACRNRQT